MMRQKAWKEATRRTCSIAEAADQQGLAARIDGDRAIDRRARQRDSADGERRAIASIWLTPPETTVRAGKKRPTIRIWLSALSIYAPDQD